MFVLAELFPVTGTVVNLALCLAVVGFTDVIRAAATRVPILAKVLGGPLEFERFYRLHPPKPFAYYAFYPLLFPYWLSVDTARRELLLYKTVNLVSLALLGGTAVYEYFEYFRPELGMADCLHILLVAAFLEMLVVMFLLMPLATSLVKYRLAGQRGRLAVLLTVGALSVVIAGVGLAHRRDPVVSWAAKERVILRTKARKAQARATQVGAVKKAWAILGKHYRDDLDTDGKVVGDAMDGAREALTKFYKADEVAAFDAWVSHKRGGKDILVLYVPAHRKKPPMFVALDRAGHETRNLKELPKGALRGMNIAADGDVLDF